MINADDIAKLPINIPIIILFKIIGKISNICFGLKSYSLILLSPNLIILNEFKIAVLFFS